MKPSRAVRLAMTATAVVSGVALSGCGGSDAEPTTSAQATSAPATTGETLSTEVSPPEQTTTTPPAPGPPPEVVAVRDRLEAAGYRVRGTSRGSDRPRSLGALRVPLGDGQVTIYVYGSSAGARKSEGRLAAVERELPDQIEVAREGTVVYVGTIEEPAVLPADAFAEIVAAGAS